MKKKVETKGHNIEKRKITPEEIITKGYKALVRDYKNYLKLLTRPWVLTALLSEEWRWLVRQYNEFDYNDPNNTTMSIGLSQAEVESIWEQCGRPEEEEWGEEEAIMLFIGDLGTLFNLTVDANVECWDTEGLTIEMI